MKHTLTYTAELAGVVARLAAELAAGAVTEGTLAEAENVLRALYQSDILWGGGWTGALPRELGWTAMRCMAFDRQATSALRGLATDGTDTWKARLVVDCMLVMMGMAFDEWPANA